MMSSFGSIDPMTKDLVRTDMLAIDTQLAPAGGGRGLLRTPPDPRVWDDDPNPVIGTILDHQGGVLSVVPMEPDRRMSY